MPLPQPYTKALIKEGQTVPPRLLLNSKLWSLQRRFFMILV